jgi:hypothetical protein
MTGEFIGRDFTELPTYDAAERQRQTEVEVDAARLNARQGLVYSAEQLIELNDTTDNRLDDSHMYGYLEQLRLAQPHNSESRSRHIGHGGRF